MVVIGHSRQGQADAFVRIHRDSLSPQRRHTTAYPDNLPEAIRTNELVSGVKSCF